MTYKPEQLREMIPLYLNGTLSEEERRTFEDDLEDNPELKHELMEFSEIKGFYKTIEEEIPLPSENLYERVLHNIRSEPVSSVTRKEGYGDRLWEYVRAFFFSPRFSWGLVAVQLGIILFLVITLPRGERFQTLTSEYTLKEEGIRINVVFDEAAMEKEIREVMTRVGAKIIDGPSPVGLYTIVVKDYQDIEQLLNVLNQTEIVIFAEKAF
ncbi:MAG: anti-sigma factor family protein [Thermodesulfobacteriota bacterium]